MKKHVFYIEGTDNVGKTTTINKFINNQECMSNIKYNRIMLSKYPTLNITNLINSYTKYITEATLKFNNTKPYRDQKLEYDRHTNYIDRKNNAIINLMSIMINDMKESFTSEDSDGDDNANDILNICDRGILSTYLYQYRNIEGKNSSRIDEVEERYFLQDFLHKYVEPIYLNNRNPSLLNIVILNNNKPEISLSTDKNETIEYKKEYDNNTSLQSKINNSLLNISKLIHLNKLKSDIVEFFCINIYDSIGNRKSTNQICKELLTIINNN